MPGAKQVLADMQAAGVPPNAVTYTILMDRLVATDDLKVMRADRQLHMLIRVLCQLGRIPLFECG